MANETAIAQVEAEIDADARTAPVRPPKQRQTNRGSLPKHLERVEIVIEPDLSCACGAERHVIGEDVSERLDVCRGNAPQGPFLILRTPGPVPGDCHPPS